ncbi:MAG: toll/interleukin-1 receptor domain-containing protein, partial [Saprospiraceae bacterium]|nr:toll/interleukin-1 receptor domain-containing protein [Saprospiraceae bacterium]
MPYEIFISYRRDDAAAEAGRLFDRISWSCPPQTVFQDVEEIKPGERWPDKIQQTLRECRLVLVVIGPDFLKVADEWGMRRIDQENDWVRLEIQTALEENKHIIPVLMEGAVMPPASALPPSIAALVQWQSFEIRRDHWNKDLSHLLAHLQTLTGVLHQVNTPVPYNPLAQLPSPEGKPPLHPFVGLRPFTAADAHIFFGRGKEIRYLYDLLTNSYDRVFLLNGPSAAGKSSLLHGGLLPRLRNKFGHIQYKRRGNDGDTDLILQEFMHSLDGDGANSLLILDQIEEIWTQPRPVDPTAAVSGSHEGEVLAQTIRQLTDNFPECRIVLGFRKEWQAEIRDLLDVANLKYKSVFLPPL